MAGAYLILGIFWLGVVLYQLMTGKLLNRYWTAWTTRKERPAIFWGTLAIQVLVTLVVFYFAFRNGFLGRH